jgi:hypothetical protein
MKTQNKGKAPRSRRFLRRKNAEQLLLGEPDCPLNKDPYGQATAVAEAWGASVHAIIRTGMLIAESLHAFAGDPDRLDAFIIALVEKGVLTPHEARRRHLAPKLVKLRTIGEHQKLLTSSQLAAFLVPSYTTLYQLTVVYGRLPEADEQQRIARLVKIIEGAPDEITRDFLINESARLNKGHRAVAAIVGGLATADAEIAPQGQPQLVLITPDRADERAITMPYATADGLDSRLPIMKDLRDRDETALVLITTVSAMPLVADALLTLGGFNCRDARYFLSRPPTSAEIGDETLIVVADRGGLRVDAPDVWLNTAEADDPRAIAAKLYPDIASRLHVFARDHARGWKCIVGAQNWREE